MSKAKVSQNQKDGTNKVSSNRNNVLKVSNKRSKCIIRQIDEPWNHRQFLKRVETFNSLKWHIRRKDVSPLFCARYGWKCVERNSLKCCGCGVNIKYQTNPSWSNEISKYLK